MKIETLQATGLQGLKPFTHKLGPVTVFTGLNMAGKTARLNALTVGLIGRIPRLGEQNISTAQIGGKVGFSVTITFDDGSYNQRIFERKGSKVDVTGTVCQEVPSIMLDASEYLSLGPKDRMRYIYDVSVRSGKIKSGPDPFIESVKKIEFLEPESLKALEGFPEHIKELWGKSQLDGADRIKDVIKTLRSELTLCNGRVKAKKELSGDRSAANRIASNPSGEIEEASEALDKLVAEKASINSKLDQISRMASRVEKLKADSAIVTADTDPITKAIKDLDEEVKGYKAKTPIAEAMVTAQKLAIVTLKNAIARTEKTIAPTRDRLAKLQTSQCCPTCGVTSEAWSEKIEASKSAVSEEIRAVESDITTNKASLSKLESKLETLVKDLESAKASDSDNESKVEQLSRLREQLAEANAAKSLANSAKLELETITESVGSDEKARALAAELANVENQLSIARARVDTLKEDLQAWNRFQADLSASQKLIEQIAKDEIEIGVYKEVIKTIEEEQSNIVNSSVSEILGAINQFTSGITPTVEFQDGKIGYDKGGVFVSEEVMSGLEKAMTFVGLSLALAQSSEIRIVMIDEFGAIHPKAQVHVLQRMNELVVSGKIDQFFAAGTTCEKVEGVTIIEV